MTRRRWEQLLWAAALVLALGGWMRWRRALRPASEPALASLAAPPPVRPVTPARLAAASEEVARNDPFRLDRSPAPLGSPTLGIGSAVGPGLTGVPPYGPAGGTFPPYTPPGGSGFGGPPLRVTGISGPPWEALLEGIPGRQGAVVVRPGDRVEDLRIRSITSDLVVVQGRDTTWRLQVKRIGQ